MVREVGEEERFKGNNGKWLEIDVLVEEVSCVFGEVVVRKWYYVRVLVFIKGWWSLVY